MGEKRKYKSVRYNFNVMKNVKMATFMNIFFIRLTLNWLHFSFATHIKFFNAYDGTEATFMILYFWRREKIDWNSVFFLLLPEIVDVIRVILLYRKCSFKASITLYRLNCLCTQRIWNTFSKAGSMWCEYVCQSIGCQYWLAVPL